MRRVDSGKENGSQGRRRRKIQSPAATNGGTAAGVYEFRRLQIGRCGGLHGRAHLAPDCCQCGAGADTETGDAASEEGVWRSADTETAKLVNASGRLFCICICTHGNCTGTQQANIPRYFRFSRHSRETKSIIFPLVSLFDAPWKTTSAFSRIFALFETL